MFANIITKAINRGKVTYLENLWNTCTDVANELAKDAEEHAARGDNMTVFSIYETNGIAADVIANFIVEQSKEIDIKIHTSDRKFAAIIIKW